MEDKEIKAWKTRIDAMSILEMCQLRRFAPSGHECFKMDSPVAVYFQDRYDELGGMTPAISKTIER